MQVLPLLSCDCLASLKVVGKALFITPTYVFFTPSETCKRFVKPDVPLQRLCWLFPSRSYLSKYAFYPLGVSTEFSGIAEFSGIWFGFIWTLKKLLRGYDNFFIMGFTPFYASLSLWISVLLFWLLGHCVSNVRAAVAKLTACQMHIQSDLLAMLVRSKPLKVHQYAM